MVYIVNVAILATFLTFLVPVILSLIAVAGLYAYDNWDDYGPLIKGIGLVIVVFLFWLATFTILERFG